jgi:hypothetical protein
LVNIKEDLIKLTDFPFAYSLTGLIIFMTFHKKIDLGNLPLNEFLPVLVFVGIIGTIISITDPFGRLTKLFILFSYKIIIRNNILNQQLEGNKKLLMFLLKDQKPQNSKKIQFLETSITVFSCLKASLNTNWINYEIDKLVANFYFLVVLILLIIIIANSDHYKIYFDFLSINQNNNSSNSTTSTNNIKLYSELRIPILGIFIGSLIGTSIIFLYSCWKLSSKLFVIGMYVFYLRIGSLLINDKSRDIIASLDNYLATHDWELAYEFLISQYH